MLRIILSFLLVFFKISPCYSSADDGLFVLDEQRPNRILISTPNGLRLYVEEPTPYPHSNFPTYMAARALAMTYAPDLPQIDVENTLIALEKLLGEKSFTPSRRQLYQSYLERWTRMPDFQDKVEVLLAHEGFLFPAPLPPAHNSDTHFRIPYALDSRAQQGNFHVYDRSFLFPEYFALSPDDLRHRVSLLEEQKKHLFTYAYGPLYSRIRAHMIHGLISMTPELMTKRLTYALSALAEKPSRDPFTNMAMLTTYASRDPDLQIASLGAVLEKLPFLMPEVARGPELYLLRKGVCSSLSFEKIDAFSKSESGIFFADCSDLTQGSPSRALSDQQYLELNNFLVRMPQEKVIPLGETFLNHSELYKIPAQKIRDIALMLSELSLEQLQILKPLTDDFFTAGVTEEELGKFVSFFSHFSQTQADATSKLLKAYSLVHPYSLGSLKKISELVFFHLSSEQSREVLSEDADNFMKNLGQKARPVFIIEGIKSLEGEKLHTFFAYGLPLFPAPLNDDPTYLRETTIQIGELEANEIPLLVQEVTSCGKQPSSPRIAQTVESLVTVRLNSPRLSVPSEMFVR